MAVVFDSSSTASGVAVTTLSWSHTSSGTNRALVASAQGALGTINSYKYDASDLTFIGSATTAGGHQTHQFKLAGQTTGPKTVEIVLSAASDVVGSVVSATNVDQSSIVGSQVSNSGSDATITVNVPSATTELVVDAALLDDFDNNGAMTVGAGQTSRVNAINGNSVSGVSTEPGAATVTMSWDVTVLPEPWVTIAVSFIEFTEPSAVEDQIFNLFEYQF